MRIGSSNFPEGVQVRVLVPQVALNQRAIVAFEQLATEGAKIAARQTRPPYDPSNPYPHAKAIVADGKVAYVGSVNMSATSFGKNRELGILLNGADTVAPITRTFNADWSIASGPIAPSR